MCNVANWEFKPMTVNSECYQCSHCGYVTTIEQIKVNGEDRCPDCGRQIMIQE